MTNILTTHHTPEPLPDTSVPDPHQDSFSKAFFGFWVYLMTDCLLFASLFISYAVLHPNTFGGPNSKELFSLKTAFAETMVLLLSSVTSGFALLAAVQSQTSRVITWLIVTFALGATFLGLELTEFSGLFQEGNSWRDSAFLSAFFTLVGTHGLHITIGLLWASVMIAQVYVHGLTTNTFRRLVLFNLFWHFLDLIWIFIFTLVYLYGVI